MSDKKPSRPTTPPPAQRPQPVRESTRDTGGRVGQDSAETSRRNDGTISFSPPPPPPPRPKK